MFHEFICKIKEAIPYIENLLKAKIRVAYKDVYLVLLIAVPPNDNLVIYEAFRNAYDCWAEAFKTIELEAAFFIIFEAVLFHIPN